MARLGDDNRRFEQAWSEAFMDAQMEPSSELWAKIDSRLANAEVRKNKGRLLFFQLLAAASFSLAMGIGIYNFVGDWETAAPVAEEMERGAQTEMGEGGITSEDTESELAQADQTDQPSEERTEESVADVSAIDGVAEVSGPDEPQQQAPVVPITPAGVDQLAHLPENSQEAGIGPTLAPSENTADQYSYDLGLASLQSLSAGPVSELGPSDIQVYRVPSNAALKKKFETQLWAGLGLGSGRFDPNYGPPGGGGLFAAADAPSSQEDLGFEPGASTAGELAARNPSGSGTISTQTNPGVAFSTGVNLGMKVSPRWILQSGLNYGNYQSSSQASAYVESGDQRIPLTASNVASESYSNSKVNLANEFNINSSYEILSVPLQAGYLLVDRKFSLSLFGGMTTEFLLNNTVSADNFSDSTVKPGEDNPFRSAYFSGVTGVGLGYALKENYIITLEPSYRLALTSMTKPGTFFRSSPNLFSVALGVRYSFK